MVLNQAFFESRRFLEPNADDSHILDGRAARRMSGYRAQYRQAWSAYLAGVERLHRPIYLDGIFRTNSMEYMDFMALVDLAGSYLERKVWGPTLEKFLSSAR